MMTTHFIFLLLMAFGVFQGVRGQAQVYSQVGGNADIVIQLPDQNTRIISPSGQTMIEVGFFGPPTVSTQYQNRVSVTNYSGGFGTPSISLTFTGVQLTDAGQFQCTSTFGGNTQCGPTLVVLGAPSLPTLSVVPDPVIVGNDVEMTCTATSTSRPPSPQLVLVYVLKQNGNVITQPRTSSFLIKGVSTANKDDVFQCAAYELNTVTNELTELTSADSDPYTLDPNFSPTDIKSDPATTSYTLKRDERIGDITCDASCNPPCDFGWYTSPEDQIVAQGKVLSLGTVTSEEAGTYVCKASNGLGEKLLPIKIDVTESLGDISFDPPEESYTVLEGTDLPGILCNADCVPACKLDWLRDGRFLYESEGIAFGQVNRDDSDTYTCRATNDKGSKEKNLALDVQYPPDSPVLSPAALRYELEENAAVIPDIACQVDCNPDCKQEWFKDEGGNPVTQGRLSLGTATRQDSGSYQCRASNLFGSVSSDLVNIQIFYRPENMTFTPPNPTYDIQEGGTLEPITCQAECNPTCTFQWYKDNDFSTPVSSSDVLDLGTADQEDSGQWTCVAKNAYGELQRQISVAVSFGPKAITLTPPRDAYDVEANVGVVPDILCSAPCNPQCSVQWLKNNAPVSSTPSPVLSLGTVTSSDEGQYTCRVTNRLGTLTKDVDVKVSFGPSSSIVLNPDRSTYDVNLGSSLKVKCSASCDPACSFRWVKDGGMEYSSTGDLAIDQAGAGDEGIYECIAENNVGSPASRKITVNVQAGPSQVSITPPGPLSLKEGADFLVTCTSSCTPECDVSWTKDNRPISSVGGVLSLNGVSKEMGGAYECTASNSIGSQTGRIQVGVVYGPGDSVQLSPNQDPFQVEEGRDFELSCSADCFPACSYSWARGRDFIAEGPTLRLATVDRSQAGLITCLANNEARTPNFQSTNFEVLYGPGSEPTIFPGEAITSVDRGDNFQARCDADCNPACQINWFLDGKKLQTSNGILTIARAKMEDEGEYTCKAGNNVGEANRNIRLQVEAGPGTSVRFDPPGSSQTAKEGSTKVVTCMADCSPPCTFHWKFGNTNISSTAALTLDPVRRQDGGVYTCVASNSQDSLSSMQLDLNVLYGPEGTTRLIPASIASLDVGDSLNLFCVAECSPPCSYTWYLGQRAVPSTDGELQVESLTLSDGGTYSCQADNGVDEKETVNIDVNIESGPAGSITFNPPNDTVTLTQGSALQVTCQAECTPDCSYAWSQGSRAVPSSSGVLVIPAVSRDDVGDYTCVAANGDGNLQASKVLSVDVLYGPGSSMELVPPGKVQTLNEGASFQISCRSDCNPACNYTWYFVNTPVASTGGVLSLVSLSKSEEGSYKCVASNGVGLSSEEDVVIQVQTGPGNSVRIDPPVSVYQIHEGKELSMTCSAVCSPDCTYTWFFGAERYKAGDGVLRQPSANRELSGSYVCYASNDVAVQGSRQIQVDVLYGPSDGVVLDPKENQQIEIGDFLTLRCSATCNPDCTYHWFKGSKKLSSTGGRLTIGPATEEAAGDYYCRATNEVEGMDSDPVSVQVLKGPGDSISFTPDVTTLDLPETGSSTVLCSADCIPPCTYQWKRGGFDDVGGAVNGSLTISNAMRNDPDLYICYASNGVGPVAFQNLQLNVQYGPSGSLSIFPPMKTVEPMGGIVSLSCKASCNPACEVQWMKGQKQLQSILGILTLTNVQASDAGDYTCVASNAIDTDTVTTTVDVVSNTGSTVEFQPPEVAPMLQEGATLSVRCSVDCIPDCDITWMKDGTVVGTGDMLEIENVERTDKGIYSCVADNSFGTKMSRLLSLDVNYGPGIAPALVPPLERQELLVGQPLISRCETECNPPCRLDWLKDGQLLNDVSNGYLLLPTVSPLDAGSYTCVADNGIGQPTFKELNVSVSFGPTDGEVTFDPPDRYRYALDGASFQVTCQADCMPACTFSWYIGNRKYEAEDGILSLDPVTKEDTGTYTCLASNGVGKTQTKDLDLFVEYKPATTRLDPPDTLYTPIKGQSLPPVTCQADCNPRCDYQWVKDDDFVVSNQRVLELRQVTSDDGGVYKCVAANVHGRMETRMEVVVHYAPSIQTFTISNRRFLASVKENSPVELYCKVDAMPMASIGFFNGSQILYGEDDTDQLSFGWAKSNCYDTGNYSCVATNGIGQTQEMAVQLEVLCSPRVDPRMPEKPLITGTIGGMATITVPIIANPPASFLWYKKKGSGIREVIDATGTPGRSRGESEMFFYVNESSSTLVIKNIQEEDFGEYVVSMVNEEGDSTITFDLVDETKVQEASTGDVDATPVLLGVGIGLGFLVGAGITVIIVATRCRPRSGHKDTSIEDWKSDTTYDTLYLRDALWAQRHMKLGSNDTYKSGSIPYTGVDLRQPDDTAMRYDAINAMKPTEIISSAL